MDPFVGRTGELAILVAEMQAVQAGQPRVVLVEGEAAIGGSARAGSARWKVADPLVVGAQLVAVLRDLQIDDRIVVVVVDDLHWSNLPSPQALLFALRRMQADRVLGLVSARPGELSRLGEGWSRFAGGITGLRACRRPRAAIPRTARAWRLRLRRRQPRQPGPVSCARPAWSSRPGRRPGQGDDRRHGGSLAQPQELQIALLAAEGLTNKQIGARLFLPHRTVGTRRYQLFPKLGVTPRAGWGR